MIMDEEKLHRIMVMEEKKAEEALLNRKRLRMTPEQRKRLLEFIIVLVAVFVVSVVIVFNYQAGLEQALRDRPTSTVTFFSHRDEGTTIHVEVAATEAERAKGLMNRSFLPVDQGMLFIFQREDVRSFWMWNTLIPLDMIFVSADKKIVYIRDNVQPCLTNDCPSYSSMYPAKYVVEVNGGFCKQNQIYEGQYIEINI
jgi:uncharacterized membrane protein (UPF0127 family)